MSDKSVESNIDKKSKKSVREDKEEFFRHAIPSKIDQLTNTSGQFLNEQLQFEMHLNNFSEVFDWLEPIKKFTLSGIPSPSMPVFVDSFHQIFTAISKSMRPILIVFYFDDKDAKKSFTDTINQELENDKELALKVNKALHQEKDVANMLKIFLEHKGYIVLDGILDLV